jgi:hypothetical protein
LLTRSFSREEGAVHLCLSCGCCLPAEDHGDRRNITIADLAAAAEAAGITLAQAAENILATVCASTGAPEDECAGEPQKFVLGVAYQAGPDPRIARGMDGGRDAFSAAELEKACWSFMLNGQLHGLHHADGTEGAARPVENYIYRNPIPWVVAPDLVVRKGDWVLGSLLDDHSWELAKADKVTGWSPQGRGRRRAWKG